MRLSGDRCCSQRFTMSKNNVTPSDGISVFLKANLKLVFYWKIWTKLSLKKASSWWTLVAWAFWQVIQSSKGGTAVGLQDVPQNAQIGWVWLPEKTRVVNRWWVKPLKNKTRPFREGCFIKHFRYLKWRNPHLCKLHTAYLREPPPSQSRPISFSTSMFGTRIFWWMFLINPSYLFLRPFIIGIGPTL